MQFQLIYDGDALSNHEINPKDLSIALLAINDLLEEANKSINGERLKIKINVKGSFQTGSFLINLTISLFDHIKDIFCSPQIATGLATEQILELLFRHDCSLFAVLKFLKGRKPDKLYENSDGTFTIYKDDKKLKIEKKVYELYKNYKLRKSFEQLVSPVLENAGISDVAVKYNNDFSNISKEEAMFFRCPEPDEERLDNDTSFETNVSIVNLSFKEGNKWFVNDGEYSFYVKVEDREFLDQIANNKVSFAKGDILKVKIRREQFYNKDEEKIKMNQFIEKVLKHSKPAEQLEIFRKE